MMQMKVESGKQGRRADAGGMFGSMVYSQPWWEGFGNNNDCPKGIREMSTSGNISLVTVGAVNSQVTSHEANIDHEIPSGIPLLRDGYTGQETQALAPSQSPLSADPSQSSRREEIVAHSMVMASYPYQDSSYGAIAPPYLSQPMVHPSLYEMHQARMPLPLDVELEPVYVNPKQYPGIMRRRQIRAKAELEKRIVKNKKPYLHESRHQHAMRRARGCGGRFLNTKKHDDGTSKSESGKDGTQKYNVTFSNELFLPRVAGNPSANGISSGYQSQPGGGQGYSNIHIDDPRRRTFPLT